MPPRLSHHKSRLGCTRCKARKVKCDEHRPQCGACARHNVPCHWPTSPAARSIATDKRDVPESPEPPHDYRDDLLEMQLMHEWSAYVCESICTTWRFWRYQAPTIAFKYRNVLDAMLALSALHASRQKPRRWVTVEGRMVSVDDGRINSMSLPAAALEGEAEWKGIDGQPVATTPRVEDDRDLNVFDPFHMLHVSRVYFDRALEGLRKALLYGLTRENARATFMCSILVSYYALFTLSEDGSNGPELPSGDPIQWFRLAHGTTLIVSQWISFAPGEWFVEAGAMYGQPDLTDEADMFRAENRAPFAYLMDAVGGDAIHAEDREGYEQALSYIGRIYLGMPRGGGSESPLATCRRVMAMPARLAGRFPALVIETRQPRALAMLAHVFAIIKLVDEEVQWFKGIAERQVPFLCRSLPPEWADLVDWPLRVVRGGEDAAAPPARRRDVGLA